MTIDATPTPVVTPRLLGFYRDVYDDEGTAAGWATIAWGLVFGDGSAITVPVEAPVSVTLWHRVEDATVALDAYIDYVDPRRTPDNGCGVPPSPCASVAPSTPSGAEHTAAQTACPGHRAASDRDRPLAGAATRPVTAPSTAHPGTDGAA
jgi:hypothetical protein